MELDTTEKKNMLTNSTCCSLMWLRCPSGGAPSTRNWDRTGQSYDRLMVASVCGILKTLAKKAFSNLKLSETLTVDDADLDPHEVELHKLTGLKFRDAESFWDDDNQIALLFIIAVVLETCRYLTRVHLHYAYAKLDGFSDDVPTTLERYGLDERSPVKRGCVHLSSIIGGDNDRLILVWRIRGCTSLEEWFIKHKKDAWVLFRLASSQLGSILWRQGRVLQELRIFAIDDPVLRTNPDEIDETITDFIITGRNAGDSLPGQYFAYCEARARELADWQENGPGYARRLDARRNQTQCNTRPKDVVPD